MNAKQILLEMHKKGIEFWCEGDNLKYRAPENAITKEELDMVKEHKEEIIALIKTMESSELVSDRTQRYEKFELTTIQNSYVRGRDTNYELRLHMRRKLMVINLKRRGIR